MNINFIYELPGSQGKKGNMLDYIYKWSKGVSLK